MSQEWTLLVHVFKCWWCVGNVAERKIHQTKTCQHISHVHKNVQIPYNLLKLYDIIFCMTIDVDKLSTWSPESKLSFDTKITQIWCIVIKILNYVLIFGPLMTLCTGLNDPGYTFQTGSGQNIEKTEYRIAKISNAKYRKQNIEAAKYRNCRISKLQNIES